ncbi:MAG: hypothetical protein IJS46_03285 [Kiritimatiellae bacterium]|nr:hypothetical protein [Kiritimatiellia bacterium]
MKAPLPPFLRAVAAVARATAVEGLQRPVVVLIALAGFELSVLQPVLQLHSFGEPGRLARDSAMAFMLVFGLVAAAFCSGEGFSRELRDGTAAASLAGPVSRTSFVIGKFLGVLSVVAVFCWCLSWAALFAARTAENFVDDEAFAGLVRDAVCGTVSIALPPLALAIGAVADWRRRRLGLWFFSSLSAMCPAAAALLGFFSRAGVFAGFAAWNPGLDWRLALPLALVFALLAAVCAWTTAFSTRLQTGASLALVSAMLGLGFFAGAAAGSPPLLRAFFAVLPDTGAFWQADALRSGGVVSAHAAAGAVFYALLHIVAALCFATASFKNKDL